jgi:hypothetical protein
MNVLAFFNFILHPADELHACHTDQQMNFYHAMEIFDCFDASTGNIHKKGGGNTQDQDQQLDHMKWI